MNLAKHTNLIKSDLLRLKKDTSFLVCLIILAAYTFFLFGIMALTYFAATSPFFSEGYLLNQSELNTMKKMLLGSSIMSSFSIGNLGFFVVIATSIFIGKDFSYNTIRNKLISGNSRTKVYLSSLGMNLIIFFIYYAITLICCVLFGLLFFQTLNGFGDCLLKNILGLPSYIFAISVANLICFLTKSQALSIVFNLLIVSLLPSILSIIVLIPLEALQTTISFIPYQILNDISASIDTFQLMSNDPVNVYSVSFLLKALLVPWAFIALANFIGILKFKSTDIK